MHSKDVVDSADAQALTKERKFCLWILTQVHAFMHSADDVCFLPGAGRRRADAAVLQLPV